MSEPCPTCTWPNRETVDMVCQTCGTDYSLPENIGPMPDSSAVHVRQSLDGREAGK